VPRWEEAPIVETKAKPVRARWESAPIVDRTPSVGDMAVGAAQNVDPGSALGRFAGGVWKNVNPVEMVKGVAQAVTSPIETGKAVVGAMGEQWEKAYHAGSEGRYSEMVGHAAAGSLPLIGPAAAAAGERIGSGDVAGGLGEAVGLVAPMAAARPVANLAGKAAAPFKGKVNQQVAAAAQRQGVEMPASALSDSKLVPLAESLSAKGIGGGQTAARYERANIALTAAADDVVKRASKFTDASEAGRGIAQGLDNFRSQWMKEKARLYKQAELPEKGMKLQAKQTVAVLNAIIREKKAAGKVLTGGPVSDVAFYEGLRKGLTKTVKPQALETTLPTIGRGEKVSGLTIKAKVPNMDSIAAEFNVGEYAVLPGVRRVPLDEFGGGGYVAADDVAKSAALTEAIKQNKWIEPLIVAYDDAGPYVVEGGHRLDALKAIGAKELPAVVVDARTVRGKPVRVLKDVEAKDVLAAMRELRAKTSASFADPFAAANKGTLKKIAATMDDEFRNALDTADPALAQKLRAADAAYKDGLGKINSTFGKQIHKLAQDGKFDKVASAIANPRVSVDDIPRIVEVVGPEGADGMRMAVLADIVNKAKGPSGNLTPQGMARAAKGYGRDRLAALLTPEQMAKLDDISTLTGAMEKGTKVMNGSQTAFLAQAAGYPAWWIADPINATLALMGNAAAARFVGSPAGQRWLTSGRNVPKGKIAIGAASIGQTGRLAEAGRRE
jgi:hypothetical protein